ncbi:MAG: hypothetical protein ACF8SC_06205 [Phycisphaerales bacterium JB037]
MAGTSPRRRSRPGAPALAFVAPLVFALSAAALLPGCYRRVTRADGFASFGTPRIYQRSDSGQTLSNLLLGPTRTREAGGTMRAWSETEPHRYRPEQRNLSAGEINDR